MRGFAWLTGLFISILLCANLSAAEIPYNGIWSGTIGTAKVQVLFAENEYDSNYYYIRHKSPIRLEQNTQHPDEWNENIGHWEPKITGIWKLEQVSANTMKGVWINPDTKEELPIELKRVAALIKDKNGVANVSAFYAPIINSLNYHYGVAKLGDIEYKTISTDSGVAFELPSTMKNVQKLNKYALEWLKEQAIASYDCQLSGGGGWQESLTAQFLLGNLLVIEDNLPDTFCGGAHGTWSHTHIIYDMDNGDFVDTTSWIKDFEKATYESGNDEKIKFRELIESLNSRSEEDNNYFSLDAPYPTKEGLVFHTSHPYVARACDEDILILYKDLAPYLTPTGKKAVLSITQEK